MKVRLQFVSNSSTTSYVFIIPDDFTADYNKLYKIYKSSAKTGLYKIPKEELLSLEDFTIKMREVVESFLEEAEIELPSVYAATLFIFLQKNMYYLGEWSTSEDGTDSFRGVHKKELFRVFFEAMCGGEV